MLSVLAPWPGLEHSTFLSVLFFWRIGALGAVHAPGFCLSVNKVCQQDPFWKENHFEMCSAATTQTIDLPPWSKYPLLAHNFIALSAMNLSAREQLWSTPSKQRVTRHPLHTCQERNQPWSRHHPSANKNWFHLIFLCYDDLPSYTTPIFAMFVLFFADWFLATIYLILQKKNRYKSTSTTSPDQQARSGPTPNSVSKKALGTKQSLPFDSQGLSAKQRHLYLAAKSQGTGSFLMDHWNMIYPPPPKKNTCIQWSFLRDVLVFRGIWEVLSLSWRVLKLYIL